MQHGLRRFSSDVKDQGRLEGDPSENFSSLPSDSSCSQRRFLVLPGIFLLVIHTLQSSLSFVLDGVVNGKGSGYKAWEE